MSLPANCKRISFSERTIVTQHMLKKDFSEATFAIYHDDFLKLLGSTPAIELALQADFPFAHEAGVYIPWQDAVYVTSNRFSPGLDKTPTIVINKLTRHARGSWDRQLLSTPVTMGNGGINYKDGILFCDQGSLDQSAGLVHMEPSAPYKTTTLLDNFHGRLFNSINDVVIHTDGTIWFTDPIYGYEQGFRGLPQLPCQVYRFDPETGDVRVVADGFGRPNGICFSPDEQTVYITDTDWIHGDGTTSDMRPSTIYAFDLIQRHGSPFLASRRVFAYSDTPIPDGIKCDLAGNVYSGCGDGVHVWNAGGSLLGKIMIPGGVANFCFGRKGELFLLNETKFWVATIAASVQGALLEGLGIKV